jgi:hypothetical protein
MPSAMGNDVRRLRYATTCSSCNEPLPAGSRGVWDAPARAATCEPCAGAPADPPAEVDTGVAGASAGREWERRHTRREQKIRDAHSLLGGLILALSDDPQSTRSWALGAGGERLLGAFLDPLRDEHLAVLHDRRIPGTRSNIDHIVVSRAGVFVIDAKRYKGQVEQRDVGGWFRTDLRLYVGGRDRTKLVTGMRQQVAAVRSTCAGARVTEPAVVPVLCFVGAEWSMFSHGHRFGDVRVVWPKLLAKLVGNGAELDPPQIESIRRALADGLPPA